MKIMAVDYGDAHTGLACCDRTQTLASPIGVIDERNFQTCVEKVAAAAVEYEVGEVVVGNPINMNGTYGPRSEKCRMFADMLQNFLEIPVVMWDERSTTVTAHNMMNDVNKRGKERKKVIDAVAAAVILQNYLDYKANLLAREKAKRDALKAAKRAAQEGSASAGETITSADAEPTQPDCGADTAQMLEAGA